MDVEEPEESEEESRKKGSKSNGSSTPSRNGASKPKKKIEVVCDSDFEPDDLLPEYMKAKTKLFELERPLQEGKKGGKKGAKKGAKQTDTPAATEDQEMEMAILRARIDRIERDVLFERAPAEHEWKTKLAALEKDYVAKKIAEKQAARKPEPAEAPSEPEPPAEQPDTAGDASAEDNDDIALQAERMAAEILARNDEDEDAGLADMFSSLPVTEVDQSGNSNTVINNSDGSRLVIRDFDKWAGVSPLRVLEEACRSR